MTNNPVIDLVAELEMLASLPVSRRSNDEIDAAMLKAAEALTAAQERIEALEGRCEDSPSMSRYRIENTCRLILAPRWIAPAPPSRRQGGRDEQETIVSVRLRVRKKRR